MAASQNTSTFVFLSGASLVSLVAIVVISGAEVTVLTVGTGLLFLSSTLRLVARRRGWGALRLETYDPSIRYFLPWLIPLGLGSVGGFTVASLSLLGVTPRSADVIAVGYVVSAVLLVLCAMMYREGSRAGRVNRT